MLRRPTSFRQLCAETKVGEMLDPIVTSDHDISGDKDVKECEGSFYFMLSIVMSKRQLTSFFFRKPALGTL